MTMKSTLSAAAIAAVLSAGAGSSAWAQGAGQTQPPAPPMQQDIGEVSDTEVERFAAAASSINDVLNTWRSRIEEVQGQPEEAALQEQAETELVAAVEGEGLSVTRYNEIVTAAQSDPQLAERLSMAVQ